MAVYCHSKIRNLKTYLSMKGGDEVLIYDLKHQAPVLFREAKEQGVKVYGATATRKTAKQDWIQFFINGKTTPNILFIQLSNGVKLYDYSNFDSIREPIPEEEMDKIGVILDNERVKGSIPWTGCRIIQNHLSDYANVALIPFRKTEEEKEYYGMLLNSFRGGANAALSRSLIDDEVHIDYHQLYAFVMTHNLFPCGAPKVISGYHKKQFALYSIIGGRARLKPDGFSLFKSLMGDKMVGLDGKWFDLEKAIGCISSVDLELLKENFEIEDLIIGTTMYYPYGFDGNKAFGEITNFIYEKRRTTTGAEKRFYKLMNEYIAGYFERTVYDSGWWKDLASPPSCGTTIDYCLDLKNAKNPIVGIFITSYGRKLLNKLLHMFPHDRVVGYDTDCVFFNGTKEEVENMAHVMAEFGDDAGQLHFDGIYKNVIHRASKSYGGYDVEQGKVVEKRSGVSKSGQVYYWDKANLDFRIKEITDEK